MTSLDQKTFDTKKYFACPDNDRGIETCLSMTLDDYFTLRSLTYTSGGFPIPRQRSYSRMFYFSAVTMSTLGYGDIVPITSRARTAVTCQVILGPVLFGLFLNALVRNKHP